MRRRSSRAATRTSSGDFYIASTNEIVDANGAAVNVSGSAATLVAGGDPHVERRSQLAHPSGFRLECPTGLGLPLRPCRQLRLGRFELGQSLFQLGAPRRLSLGPLGELTQVRVDAGQFGRRFGRVAFQAGHRVAKRSDAVDGLVARLVGLRCGRSHLGERSAGLAKRIGGRLGGLRGRCRLVLRLFQRRARRA